MGFFQLEFCCIGHSASGYEAIAWNSLSLGVICSSSFPGFRPRRKHLLWADSLNHANKLLFKHVGLIWLLGIPFVLLGLLISCAYLGWRFVWVFVSGGVHLELEVSSASDLELRGGFNLSVTRIGRWDVTPWLSGGDYGWLHVRSEGTLIPWAPSVLKVNVGRLLSSYLQRALCTIGWL